MAFFTRKTPTYTIAFQDLADNASAEARMATSAVDWTQDVPDGKLAIDVAETEQGVIVVSTLAGAVYEELEVHVHDDVLTIRGTRQSPIPQRPDIALMVQECYWGRFSRTIVLPAPVRGEAARAEYRNGILVVTIPKRTAEARVPIIVVEE